MDRLTKQNPSWINNEFWTAAEEPDDEEMDKVYMRLMDYENTGLIPTEITRLTAENEALREDLKSLGSCTNCIHNKYPCEREDNGHETCWQWRGEKEKSTI